MSQRLQAYFRNFIFGVEDSLVSTVALLSGIATAGVSRSDIILTGVVLVFVEAFSMAVGSFLSERSAEEFVTHHDGPERPALIEGAIMFASYFGSGFIPIAPYLFATVESAMWISVLISLIALFGLGAVSARVSRMRIWHGGLRMFLLGGLAIALGVAVGSFFA